MRTKHGRGFTLIELVVVIVILGILAATAAPKFMDLQRDARIGAIQGLVGAVRSAVSMVLDKSIIVGRERLPRSCIWTFSEGAYDDNCDPTKTSAKNNDDAIFTAYGWPEATGNGLVRTLSEAPLEYKDESTSYDSDWVYKEVLQTNPKAPKQLLIWPANANKVEITSEGLVGCGIVYTEGSENTRPVLKIVKDDC